jgi:methionine-rich copper-binding protein CopC
MTFNRATAIAITAVAVAALTAIGPVAVSPARAHAQLLTNSPAVSSTLTKQPKQVSLVFDDDLIDLAGGNQIVVTNAAQKHVESGATKLDGATVSVGLKPGLANGRYEVQYKVISDDGHPVTGTYFFYLKLAKKK